MAPMAKPRATELCLENMLDEEFCDEREEEFEKGERSALPILASMRFRGIKYVVLCHDCVFRLTTSRAIGISSPGTNCKMAQSAPSHFYELVMSPLCRNQKDERSLT